MEGAQPLCPSLRSPFPPDDAPNRDHVPSTHPLLGTDVWSSSALQDIYAKGGKQRLLTGWLGGCSPGASTIILPANYLSCVCEACSLSVMRGGHVRCRCGSACWLVFGSPPAPLRRPTSLATCSTSSTKPSPSGDPTRSSAWSHNLPCCRISALHSLG